MGGRQYPPGSGESTTLGAPVKHETLAGLLETTALEPGNHTVTTQRRHGRGIAQGDDPG